MQVAHHDNVHSTTFAPFRMDRSILIDGLTPEQVLRLPDDEMLAFVLCGEPIIFRAGTAEILGKFFLQSSNLCLELVQISGGGEGVLPTLAALANRYARDKGLTHVEWRVHATNCANPNAKLRRVLVRRGFQVRTIPGTGECYYLCEPTETLADVTLSSIEREFYEALPDEVPDHSESMTYYPRFSRILPNGNLLMATAGVGKDGERWTGSREISPNHPLYPEWKRTIEIQTRANLTDRTWST